MADGVMGEIVRNDVNKTEKRHEDRFLTGFSIQMVKTVGARPVEIKRKESAFEHDDLSRALPL